MEVAHLVVLELYAHVINRTVLVLDARHQLVEQTPRLDRQTTTTHFLTREGRMIDHRAFYTCLLQQTTTDRSCRTGSNDKDINRSQILHLDTNYLKSTYP